eukprot:TRINITY_DN2529_c0_g1_i4.p1 TRINITY_DN2529_c0_g1~~TRINITY_DN2529_c0_g1_i4.p1  ORF type:complete len:114 (-),score=11.83 TRINITY_DN2529_c0_g1_i4:1273-1614(-)
MCTKIMTLRAGNLGACMHTTQMMDQSDFHTLITETVGHKRSKTFNNCRKPMQLYNCLLPPQDFIVAVPSPNSTKCILRAWVLKLALHLRDRYAITDSQIAFPPPSITDINDHC